MRRRYDPPEQGPEFRTSGIQTPRSIKPPTPLDFSRQSTTPSRIQERLSTSPLKMPLSKAVSRAVKKDASMDRSSSSRYLGRSSRKEDSSIIEMAKRIYYQEDSQTQMMRAHPETYEFIRKNFADCSQDIPLERFIQAILKDYEHLWGTQNVDKIFDDFTYKIADIFGCDYVDLRELGRITKQDGMIGLILRIFKEVKNQDNIRTSNYVSFHQQPNVQSIHRSFQDRLTDNESVSGLKNVVQEFMESMYQAMESQIYARYNVEMKRMVIKYRDTEKLLKKTNDKITAYADVIDFDKKLRDKQREHEQIVRNLKQEKEKLEAELAREQQSKVNDKAEKERLMSENSKLKENLEKYQNVLLNKAMENDDFKRNSRISERPSYENMRISQVAPPPPPEPFKITIDTHVVHKENKPPETKTMTTFHPPISPHRDSYDKPPISVSHVSPAHFGSRVSNHRPLSPYSTNYNTRPY